MTSFYYIASRFHEQYLKSFTDVVALDKEE